MKLNKTDFVLGKIYLTDVHNKHLVLVLMRRNVWLSFLFLCIFNLVVSFAHANENNIALDSAKSAYSKGNFEKAISAYKNIIDNGLEAPEVYFNLGNTYYKTNKIGLAILNYERAKKLSPDDEDILFNLKLANQKTEDKIEAAPQLFLSEWKNGIVDLMTEKSWSMLCIALLITGILLIGIYITSTIKSVKQIGFFGGVVLIISTIITFFIAQQKYNITKSSKDAIITAATVTVNGSPDEKGTKLFILHEGTKVSITQEDANWIEIKIANGNAGWIKSTLLQKI